MVRYENMLAWVAGYTSWECGTERHFVPMLAHFFGKTQEQVYADLRDYRSTSNVVESFPRPMGVTRPEVGR